VLVFLTIISATPAAAQDPSAGSSHKANPLRKDCYGDPLPPNALARLGSMRLRLNGQIQDVAFAPGSKIVAIAGSEITKEEKNSTYLNPTLRLWNAVTARVVRTFKGEVKASGDWAQIGFSPDGKTLAALVRFSALTIWDAATGKLEREITLPESLNCFAWSPDGKTVAVAGGPSGKVIFCDVNTGHQRQRGLQATPITALAYSADGKFLTSTSMTIYDMTKDKSKPKVTPGRIIRWSVLEEKTVQAVTHETTYVKLSPEGSRAAWAGKDKKVHVVDVTEEKEASTIPGEQHSFVFSPDGKILATGTQSAAEGRITLWDASTGKRLRQVDDFVGRSSRVVAFSADGKLLASLNWDWGYWNLGNSVRFWNVETGHELSPAPAHRGDITCTAYSPDGALIASGSQDKTVRLWDAKTGKPSLVLDDHGAAVSAVAFAPNGKLLASAAGDRSVNVWQTKTGRNLHQFTMKSPAVALSYSPDGKTLLALGQDGTVCSWRGTEARSFSFDQAQPPIGFAAFSSEAGTFAAIERGNLMGLGINHLQMRSTATGRVVSTIRLPAPAAQGGHILLWTAAFTKDARYLITSESLQTFGLRVILSEHTLRLWEVATGKEIQAIKGLPNPAHALAVSPDGRFLASAHGMRAGPWIGTVDRVVLLWDLISGFKLDEARGHAEGVTAIAFSPDGRGLVSGSSDHLLLTWDAKALTTKVTRLPQEMTDAALKGWWHDLAGNDPLRAYRAVLFLTAASQSSIKFLREQLKPVPQPEPKQIDPLIADLNNDKFAVRQKAMAALEKLGETAGPALREALAGGESLEFRRRIEQLLAKLDGPPSQRNLLAMRALTVLERSGAPEARMLLEELSRGAAGARLTREAQAALVRLGGTL
jgi:WD40 repeat protein